MSFHLQLRAIAPEEMREDATWIEPFLRAAWLDHRQEYEAGGATSIEKDFAGVNHLYTGAPDGDGDPAALPIWAGDPVFREDGPPFLVLRPEQVEAAGAFLTAADFGALWELRGEAVCAEAWGQVTPLAREVFLDHHAALVAFFRAAADRRQAVLKAFWY